MSRQRCRILIPFRYMIGLFCFSVCCPVVPCLQSGMCRISVVYQPFSKGKELSPKQPFVNCERVLLFFPFYSRFLSCSQINDMRQIRKSSHGLQPVIVFLKVLMRHIGRRMLFLFVLPLLHKSDDNEFSYPGNHQN